MGGFHFGARDLAAIGAAITKGDLYRHGVIAS
jgi:hypothetical protein